MLRGKKGPRRALGKSRLESGSGILLRTNGSREGIDFIMRGTIEEKTLSLHGIKEKKV